MHCHSRAQEVHQASAAPGWCDNIRLWAFSWKKKKRRKKKRKKHFHECKLTGATHLCSWILFRSTIVELSSRQEIGKGLRVVYVFIPGSLKVGEGSQHGQSHRKWTAMPPTSWREHKEHTISAFFSSFLFHLGGWSDFVILLPTFLLGRYMRGLQMGTGPWIKDKLSSDKRLSKLVEQYDTNQKCDFNTIIWAFFLSRWCWNYAIFDKHLWPWVIFKCMI